MNTYKNTHFTHHRAVLEHFLKVGEARLHKLFKFERFGACTPDHNGILKKKCFWKGDFNEPSLHLTQEGQANP